MQQRKLLPQDKKRPAIQEAPQQIPLYLKGKLVEHAIVDADNFKRFSGHKWIFDKQTKQAYREVVENGLTKKILLHKEVLGTAHGDGQTTLFHDGNKLNCQRANLAPGVKRNMAHLLRRADGKTWPRTIDQFLNYFRKNYPEIAEFLEYGRIIKYGIRNVSLSFEEETEELKRAQHHSFKDKLLHVLKTDFDFPGDIHIIKHASVAPLTPISAEKPIPQPAAVTTPQPTVVASTPKPQGSFDAFTAIKDNVDRVQRGELLGFSFSFAHNGRVLNIGVQDNQMQVKTDMPIPSHSPQPASAAAN